MPLTTDPTAAALLRAILADPADDTPRLIYADRLEEHGDSARAEFIRVQVELARMDFDMDFNSFLVGCWNVLRRRERELLETHGRDWTPPGACLATGYQPRSWPFSRPWEFHRGFVTSVTCTTAAWMEHGPALVRRCPLERVWLSDRHPCPVTRQAREWIGGASRHEAERWLWASDRRWDEGEQPTTGFSLPPAIFRHLEGGQLLRGHRSRGTRDVRTYDTEAAALDVLPTAAIAWSRAQASP